jgi:poly-gamma-glutamate capsule biosynthesis protein CapA/YwtB (metallophosphatase superfamily)
LSAHVKVPRWFRPRDRSTRFRLDRATGRIAAPDRSGPAGAEHLVLYASGDIIWERDLMAHLLTQAPAYPFAEVRGLWAGADLVFAQLETVFGPRADATPWEPDKRISYLTDPALIPHFVAGGFNLACLASNHTMDHGLGPIEFTRSQLAAAGIATSGSGADLAAARQPALVQVKGKTVALLSYATDDANSNAGEASPGNAPFRRQLVIEDVLRARQKADFILVSVHKGREFVDFPAPEHQADCRAIVDAGADLILGHHPHFLQGVEWRRRPDGRQALILYSLGSLLVDYEPFLSQSELALFQRSQRNNAVFRIELDARGVAALAATPVRQTADWRVRLETPAEAALTLDNLEWCSHPLNHEPLCGKFWVTGGPYLAIQYPSIWMHLKRRPSYLASALRWWFREETFRLHWGCLFAREAPSLVLGLRSLLFGLLRLPFRLLRLLIPRGGR